MPPGPGMVYNGTPRVNVNPVRNFPVQGDPRVACPDNGPGLAIDTNDLEWFTINTGAGQAQADVLIQFAKARRRIHYMSNIGAPAREIYLYLTPFNSNKAAGGVLAIDGTEQWFQLFPSIANIGVAGLENLRVLEFAKPVSKIYLAHPDFGTGTNIVLLASEDVAYAQDF